MIAECVSESLQVPDIPPDTGVAYRKLMVMKGDMGIVGAAVLLTVDKQSNVCKNARIALSNAAAVPLRVKQAERTLIGNVIGENLLVQAGEAAAAEANPSEDVHGSAEYRREMIKVFVKRVALIALEKARAA